MTSWIWMKGVGVAVAEPIALVNEHDDRPSVKKLIDDNRKVIDQVKKELETDPLYDVSKHDHLWILRFLLSHKLNTNLSLKAAKTTLEFRQTHKLDEKDIRHSPADNKCKNEIVRRFVSFCEDDAIRFTVPDTQRGVIAYLHLAGMNQHEMVKHIEKELWLPYLGYFSEWTFQWCDYVTRTTGRLTKSVRLMDTRGFTLSSISSEGLKRDGAAMGIMEDCYPQMLQGIFICNPPTWVHIPWKICRSLMPKRVVEKIDFINPHKSEKERRRLWKHISEEHLPVCYGGKYDGGGDHRCLPAEEAECPAAELEAFKKEAAAAAVEGDGDEADEFDEIYDDIPVT